MKQPLFLLLFFVVNILMSQEKKPVFGKITDTEKDITVYQKDSTANAVFLYERGETVFKDTRFRILISTHYYARIKLFNKEGFDYATVEIPIYNNKEASEKVKDIKAVTHNGERQVYLAAANVYTERKNEYWSVVKFTLPDIKEGSIIEYEYTLESPFKFNFKGWTFQNDIPKIYSEFHALIPGNYVYNRRLSGYQELLLNESKLKKNCFSVEGISKMADCEEVTYAMENIPAFIEEDYMTAKVNHISAINFELSEFMGFDGVKYKYTKTWEDVDKEFRTEKTVGVQLRKVDYLEKRLPEDILITEPLLERAKKVYAFIQNHFRWDGKLRLFNEVNVKKAFDEQVGNAAEINIALINALNAAGIETYALLLSTRENGLPTRLHPVITDFNYLVAKTDIDGVTYLLDATQRSLPFGTLPLRALNGYGRVMEFKKGSYWLDINPEKNSVIQTTLTIELTEDGNFKGLAHRMYNGYAAIDKREEILSKSEEEYLMKLEDKHNKLIIDSYKNENLTDIDQPLKELMDITIESELEGDKLIINPFLLSKISINPFKLKERSYPVDFGYPKTIQYILKLKIPENYKVISLTENVSIKLPASGGVYIFSIENKDNKINLISRLMLTKSQYSPEEYHYLKEFYNRIIKTQNSLITLEKK